jgi:murein DD-endopeptidase MepM/ murein hydrolase activator NlpD
MPLEFNEPSHAQDLYESEGILLSAPFEGRRPLLQGWGENPQHYAHYQIGNVPLRGHNGIDFDLPGGTHILAVDSGQVVEIGNDRQGYGRFLVIQHWWGESLYAHLQGFNVEAGERCSRGQLIGFSGSSGVSARPHLHLAVRIVPYDRLDGWGGYTNPLPFMEASTVMVSPRRTL